MIYYSPCLIRKYIGCLNLFWFCYCLWYYWAQTYLSHWPPSQPAPHLPNTPSQTYSPSCPQHTQPHQTPSQYSSSLQYWLYSVLTMIDVYMSRYCCWCRVWWGDWCGYLIWFVRWGVGDWFVRGCLWRVGSMGLFLDGSSRYRGLFVILVGVWVGCLDWGIWLIWSLA